MTTISQHFTRLSWWRRCWRRGAVYLEDGLAGLNRLAKWWKRLVNEHTEN